MHRILVFLLLTPTLAGLARAQIYTWVDSHGVHHFSDIAASPHARPAHLSGLQWVEGHTLKQPPGPRTAGGNHSAQGAAASFRKPVITQPKDGATIRSGQGKLPITLKLGGRSQLRSGEQLTYYLDGQPIPKSPTTRTSLQLVGVVRGTHHLSVALLYRGHEIRRSAPLTFYMKRPAAISPLNVGQGQTSNVQNPLGVPVATPAGEVAGAPAAPRFNTTSASAGAAPR